MAYFKTRGNVYSIKIDKLYLKKNFSTYSKFFFAENVCIGVHNTGLKHLRDI